MTLQLAYKVPARKRPSRPQLTLFLHFLFSLIVMLSCTDELLANTIKNVVIGPLQATRGDLIKLTVEPLEPSSTVQWWSNGELICEKTDCLIDTNQFTSGEYQYHVVVKHLKGIEIATVPVFIENAPALYKVKTVASLRMGPNQRDTFAERGHWIIVPRGGLVQILRKQGQKKSSVVNFVEKAIKGAKYRVGHGGTAIVRRVGFSEEWIVPGNSSFRIDDDGLELLSGAGIWRKYSEDPSRANVGKIFGLRIESKESQIIMVGSSANSNDLSRRILNIEGLSVGVDCPQGQRIQLPIKGRLDLEESIHCRTTVNETWDDVEDFIYIAFPWWGELHSELPIDRWRVEADRHDLFFAADKDTELLVSAAFKRGQCGDVLDLSSRFVDMPSHVLFIRAQCQLTLGLKTEALKNLKILESRRIDPPMVAFLLARSFHQNKKFDQALYWYEQAKDRGYQNLAELSRYAVSAAQDLGQPREQLAWLDSAALSETDPNRQSKDFENQRFWRKTRPVGGRIDFGLYVDSQVVPANPKALDEMPNDTESSRGIIINAGGDWWTRRNVIQNAGFFLNGHHGLRLPMAASQSSFAIAEHDVRLGLFFDERTSQQTGEQTQKSWILRPAAIIGTATLGSFRVRERFGAEVLLSFVNDQTYSLGLESNKYLDPAPGGVDIVDTKLFRLAEPGDFSFIDYVVKVGIENLVGPLEWSSRLDFGRVDYRSVDFVGFDHNFWSLTAEFSKRLSPSMTVDLTPSYLSRQYVTSAASETLSNLRSTFTWHPVPLWRGKLEVSLETRRVSNDPISSWSRHIYGAALSTDF